MPKPAKLLPRIALLIVVAGAIVATLVWWHRSNQPKEILLSGTLEARTVEVGSLTGGRVVRVLIDEGQPVAAGQLLAQLETTTIDRQLDEQKAAIQAAQANLAKMIAGPRTEEIAKAKAVAANDERDRMRQEHLWHDGVVAKQVFDDAVTKAKASAEDYRELARGNRPEDIAAARADLEQQQRRLDTLLKQRAETNVYSSVTGTVQSMGLRPGDLIGPNQAVAELLESSQLWVRVYVPETQLGLVHIGMPVHVRTDTAPNRWFPGHVSAINPQAEYTPRNVQTRAQRIEQVVGVKVLVDPSPDLHPGMAVDVDLGVKGSPD